MLHREICILLGRSSDSVPEAEVGAQRLGESIFQTTADQLARETLVRVVGHNTM